MIIPLSTRTNKVAHTLLREPELNRILKRLVDDVSENIPCCENSGPKDMERIRFSILKLIAEHPENEERAFNLAQVDWRDLLMSAGFGHSATEHKKWFQKIMKNKG